MEVAHPPHRHHVRSGQAILLGGARRQIGYAAGMVDGVGRFQIGEVRHHLQGVLELRVAQPDRTAWLSRDHRIPSVRH